MGAGVLILLAALALVEVARALRDARRARRMNRAMHELRRPLQAIALSLETASPDLGGAAACLEQARGALRELDAIVNGAGEAPPVSRAAVAEVLVALERRWRFADVEVERGGGAIEVDADPTRLAAALDNLVVNALRHGSGVVRVRAIVARGSVRFEVRDGGPGPRRRCRAAARSPAWARPARRRRRRRQPWRPGDAGRTGSRRRHHGGDLPATRRGGRRSMSRRGRAVAFAALALVCGIASASIATGYRDRVDEQLGETRAVLTLNRPSARGPACGRRLLRRALRGRARFRSGSCLRMRSRARRRRPAAALAVPVPAGSYLLGSQLRTAGRRPDRGPRLGERLHPVEVTVSGAGALASAGGGGTRVDVVVAAEPVTGGRARVSVAAARVRLLAIAPGSAGGRDGRGIGRLERDAGADAPAGPRPDRGRELRPRDPVDTRLMSDGRPTTSACSPRSCGNA